MIQELIREFNIKGVIEYKKLQREEDDSFYDVYLLVTEKGKFILKKSSFKELSNYLFLANNMKKHVPKLHRSYEYNDDIYILIEYIEGTNLQKCNKENLIKVLDAIIYIQNKYWNELEYNQIIKHSYEDTLKHRIKRGSYLKDPILVDTYNDFLEVYQSVPRTFSHDDLLPFNVLVNETSAYLIDWEYASMMPYPTSLARLIAHTEDKEDYLFYMSETDKEFAIKYYYDNLIKDKNISYEEYIKTLNYFLYFEYTEWIMLGEKYNDRSSTRYKEYYEKAIKHIKENLSK